MVIRDFYLMRSVSFPDETDPMLIVDSDAVLSRTVALQSLQTIPWRKAKIAQ